MQSQRKKATQRRQNNSRGQLKFKKGNRYITPDMDEHIRGYWKMLDKDGIRIGTYNDDLTHKLGD